MVFQSCIPVTIGILLTPWHIDLSNSVQLLQAVAIAIALVTAVVLYVRSSHKELHISGLMLGGVMYAFFIALGSSLPTITGLLLSIHTLLVARSSCPHPRDGVEPRADQPTL